MNDSAPRIWLLIGDKLGDNAQVQAIVERLNLPCTLKRLLPQAAYVKGKPRFAASLDHLDLSRSDPLEAPWPDMIITIGRRHAMAALWVKARHPATRIVLLGRPRRWIEKFDLVITPPQYQMPALPNTLRLELPLMRPDPQAISGAADAWAERFSTLDRPLIGVLIGGPTHPLRLDKTVARTLLAQCRELAERYRATLYFSTSRRTPAGVVATIDAERPENSRLYAWSANAGDNPYQALLGLADYFIVTGDSMSMMTEAAACGKPVAIFPLPASGLGRLWLHIKKALFAEQHDSLAGRLYAAIGRALYASGITGFGRDLGRIHAHFIKLGLATWPEQAFEPPRTALPDELQAVCRRIQALLADTRHTHTRPDPE